MHLSMQIKDKLLQPGCGDGGGCLSPLIPVLGLWGRGRQISEFKASMFYRVSVKTAKATQRNSVLKNRNPTN